MSDQPDPLNQRAAEWQFERGELPFFSTEAALIRDLEADRQRLLMALRSIANSACCTGCQEAALVAKAALSGDHDHE